MARKKESTNIARAMLGGIAGTALMTVVADRLADALHADTINHADFLAGLTHSGKAMGEIEHYTLGGVLMPAAYAHAAPHLARSRVWRGLEWGGLLWAAAETSLSPAAGKGAFETRANRPGGALLASLAGHLVYGLTQTLVAG